MAIQLKCKELSTINSVHFCLLSKRKPDFPITTNLFESLNSMKMKGTFSCRFGFTFKVNVRLFRLVIYSVSGNSIKMKSTPTVIWTLLSQTFGSLCPTHQGRLALSFRILWENASAYSGEVLHGVGLPLPTLLQS